MHAKEPQEPPEHTSEHVKSQTFLGACPQTPLTQFILLGPTFCICPGPPQSSRRSWSLSFFSLFLSHLYFSSFFLNDFDKVKVWLSGLEHVHNWACTSHFALATPHSPRFLSQCRCWSHWAVRAAWDTRVCSPLATQLPEMHPFSAIQYWLLTT